MKTYVVHKKFFVYCNRLCFMVYLWYISSNTEGNPNGGSCDMKFVRTEDLKAGMRLAKPIYNKKGVLLYERNSALTAPGIASAKNFGLIGVYILEPAEPLPPRRRSCPLPVLRSASGTCIRSAKISSVSLRSSASI